MADNGISAIKIGGIYRRSSTRGIQIPEIRTFEGPFSLQPKKKTKKKNYDFLNEINAMPRTFDILDAIE